MASIDHSLFRAEAMVGGEVRGVRDLARLRLGSGLLLILIALVGLLGGDWDIQWHAVIGRDRTFTPPHDLILLGIGLAGIVALGSILIETAWVRRHPNLRPYSTDFLGVLRSSLGLYLVGFGAVCSAVAFPLDTYWHALYGIDVSLWAPFHTMIYMGGVLSAFGTLYLLVSAAHLSELSHGRWTALLSYAGVVVSLGLLLSKFGTFLTPALAGHNLVLGPLVLNFFPFLMALTSIFVCMLAIRLIPWMGAATLVVAVFLLIWLLISAFLPPLMTLLVQAEHETFLARASRLGAVTIPLIGQTPLVLLTSLCLDGVVWLGRRGGWTPRKQNVWLLVAAMVSFVLVAGSVLIAVRLGPRTVRGGGLGASFLLSLLMIVPGCLLGNWLVRTIGESMQGLRR